MGKRPGTGTVTNPGKKKSRSNGKDALAHWETKVIPLLDNEKAKGDMALHLFETLWLSAERILPKRLSAQCVTK